MTTTLKIVKPQTEAEKATSTTMDTIEVTPNLVRSWKIPPFQRALRVNEKVMLLAQTIKNQDGVIPGIMTIGVLDKERYLVDGQHRREAFLLSESPVGYVDVRILHFADMAEMGEEYVNLNSRLVQMRPDDILRGLEETYDVLKKIRRRCPFVGYDQIRRSDKAPVVSMSALLRCWSASQHDVPSSGAASAAKMASTLSEQDADRIIAFLGLAVNAWGREQQYHRLWLNLNLSVCMWLYRRICTGEIQMSAFARAQNIESTLFGKCLMSLSADAGYVDWLLGRHHGARDLSPAYSKIKAIFARRVEHETGRKQLMPAPAWAVSK